MQNKTVVKPLIRWSIGNSLQTSHDCLRKSIINWKKLYGDRFDYIVCHNNCDIRKLNFDIPLCDQSQFVSTLPISPKKTAWKLYPPRIRPNAHEIFMDNDLVVTHRLPVIEEFLESTSMTFSTQAIRRSYGIYDESVCENININTGFFGIPPEFYFGEMIKSKIIEEWTTWFDEQGLVASILLTGKPFRLIPLDDIWICNNELQYNHHGLHFIRLNGGQTKFWNEYMTGKLI